MRRPFLSIAIVILAPWISAFSCHAAEGQSGSVEELRRNVRNFFQTQDAVAAGGIGAVKRQQELLADISSALRLHAEGDQIDVGLPELVALFVLSGGDPAVAEAYAARPGLSAPSFKLLRLSALARSGDSAGTLELFGDLKLNSLPPDLGGTLALATANLLPRDDPRRIDNLAKAAALMPGTLVEEASLRRLADYYASNGTDAQFWQTIDRYMRRFGRSAYLHELLDTTFRFLLESGDGKDGTELRRLDVVLTALPLPERRRAYSELMRTAAMHGRSSQVRNLARRVRRLAVSGSVEQDQADIYEFAYSLATDEHERAAAILSRLQHDKVLEHDRSLFQSALRLIREIEAPFTAGTAPVAPDDLQPEPAMRALEHRTENVLRQSDHALGEFQQ